MRSKTQKMWGSLLKPWNAFHALQIYNFHLVQTLNYTKGWHFTCEEALFRALEQAALRWWHVLLWKYSNAPWIWSCAMCCRWTCFSSGVRRPSEVPSNPHNSVFCETRLLDSLVSTTTLQWLSLLMEQLNSAGMSAVCHRAQHGLS